jgi:cyclopropane-fatty-acyl-phospholipid synthase
MLLRSLLHAAIQQGAVRLIDASNRTFVIGDGQAPSCTLRLKRRHLDWSIALNPSIRLAEAYMNGLIGIEDGSLYDFLDLLVRNTSTVGLDEHWLTLGTETFLRLARRIKRHNPIQRARRNVAHHYDLSEELYRLFLDDDMQYSCAYFREPGMSLERAQIEKKRLLTAKLYINRPELKVLDIGSGWGGLGLHLAGEAGCDVTGVTLSVEQHRVSQDRARAAGLDAKVRFDLRDYREIQGSFDRIVSVGMFEHVGKGNYPEFFHKLRDLLADDGVCVLHTIGRSNEPGPVNPFMRKYIFPGGDLPCLSEVLPVVEQSGLLITDIEILRLHYAETLRHWRQRFQANRDRIRELYDERFCRMWEIYLAAAELSFIHQNMVVFQIQLTKRPDAVPLTRDYMTLSPVETALLDRAAYPLRVGQSP